MLTSNLFGVLCIFLTKLDSPFSNAQFRGRRFKHYRADQNARCGGDVAYSPSIYFIVYTKI